ncbi:vitamin K epoxide reductase family protein [Candidatus Gottesmanbacteria bacterium]|nr:vitamin K epoxide reductase family protein [Candidatus Gottesmanbacteria bacterium]
MRTNRVIFILSLAGIIIAIYVLQSFLRDAPIVCLNSGCELVRKNPASYILGIPVPAIGLIGYSVLAILAFAKTTKDVNKRVISSLMLGIATFGAFFVTWFTYTELFVIRAVCTWCAVSAANMFIIFFLTLKNKKQ